jgi:hypothetical protein
MGALGFIDPRNEFSVGNAHNRYRHRGQGSNFGLPACIIKIEVEFD